MNDMKPDDATSRGSQLCLSCGLCCQGVMEKAAVLEVDELDLAEELKLAHSTGSDGIHKFRLPCPLLNESTCTVYRNRHPNVCTQFQCLLLDQLLDNEIDLEASLKIILKIKKYISQIREKVTFIDRSKSFMDTVQDCWESQQELDEELLFDIAAFRYLIFRYIMGPSKPYSIDRLFFPQHTSKESDC